MGYRLNFPDVVRHQLICSYGMGKCTQTKIRPPTLEKSEITRDETNDRREVLKISARLKGSKGTREGWTSWRGLFTSVKPSEKLPPEASAECRDAAVAGGLRGGREVSLPRVGQWHTHLRGEGGSLKPPLPFRRPMNESPADDFFDVLPHPPVPAFKGWFPYSFIASLSPHVFRF